jgi:hypothetical protein
MSIYNLRLVHLPAFRFEWHPSSKALFVIELGKTVGGKELAEQIAGDIRTEGEATDAALIWGRGYKAGRSYKLDLRSVSEA